MREFREIGRLVMDDVVGIRASPGPASLPISSGAEKKCSSLRVREVPMPASCSIR